MAAADSLTLAWHQFAFSLCKPHQRCYSGNHSHSSWLASISSIGLVVCRGLWTNSPFNSSSLLTALMAGVQILEFIIAQHMVAILHRGCTTSGNMKVSQDTQMWLHIPHSILRKLCVCIGRESNKERGEERLGNFWIDLINTRNSNQSFDTSHMNTRCTSRLDCYRKPWKNPQRTTAVVQNNLIEFIYL